MSLADAVRDGLLDPSHIGTVTWTPRVLWRVYPQAHGAGGFNGTNRGNARFSPIEHGGAIVPILYAGTTVEVALMETVLHDAPPHSAGFVLTLNATTEPRRVASLMPSADLLLADLSTLGLRRLGLGRPDVIDCDKSGYPRTRALAQWIYAHRPDVHGIAWTSRQDDRNQAVVLFQPRLAGVTLQVRSDGESFTDGAHFGSLMNLLERPGATLHVDY